MKMKIKKSTVPLLLFLSVPLLLFLSVPLLSFFTEGMIGNKTIIIVILLTSIILNLMNIKKEIVIWNGYWIIYIVAVLLSVAQRDINESYIKEIIIYLFMIVFMITCNCSWESIKLGYKFIKIMGYIAAVFVLIHLVLGESFNRLIFPLYTDYWKGYMSSYFKKGYYMGIHPVPGDAAGVILMLIGMLFISYLIKKSFRRDKSLNIQRLIVCLFLLIPLFATGKKGVLFAGIIALLLIAIFMYGNRKQWIRAIIIIAAFLLGIVFVRYYAITHSDNAIFYRINKFLNQISEGSDYSSGRSILSTYALSLWRDRPLFGIGWRKFREYSTVLNRFGEMHDVNMDYLQFLCEAGIVGFVLIITTIAVNSHRAILAFRSIMKRKNSDNNFEIVIYSVFIQLFTVIYALFEIPFFDRMFFFPIYLFSFISISKYCLENKKSMTHRVKSKL